MGSGFLIYFSPRNLIKTGKCLVFSRLLSCPGAILLLPSASGSSRGGSGGLVRSPAPEVRPGPQRRVGSASALVSVAELVMLLEWWSGTECVIYTDPRAYPMFGRENAIVVLNHKFEIDFLCGWSLAERFGVLGVSGGPLAF